MDKRARLQKMHRVVSALLLFGVWFGPMDLVSGQSLPDRWSVSRGDPGSQGVSPSKLSQQPKLLWEHSISTTSFETTPIIVDGHVYLGDLDGEFYALDLLNGKELWKDKSESGYVAAAASY